MKSLNFLDPGLSSLSEGDMLLDKKDKQIMDEVSLKPSMKKDGSRATKRGIVANLQKLWLSRVVPYEIFHPGTSTGKNSGKCVHKFRFFNFQPFVLFPMGGGWTIFRKVHNG